MSVLRKVTVNTTPVCLEVSDAIKLLFVELVLCLLFV